MKGLRTCSVMVYNFGKAELLEVAHHAERLGFAGLWFGEHYLIPGDSESVHPASATSGTSGQTPLHNKLPDTQIYDPLTQAALVVATTERLKVGTAVSIVPLNNPLILARQTITLHDMSEGRLQLGVGAGWLKEEFDAIGVPYSERGTRLDESLDILRKAWAGGFFSHDGPFHSFEQIKLTSTPARIPIFAGGNSKRAARRAARVGDSWINSGAVTPELAVELRAGIEAERKAQGTDWRPFDYYVRPPAPDVELIRQFVAAGFADVIIQGGPARSQLAVPERIAHLEQVALELGLS